MSQESIRDPERELLEMEKELWRARTRILKLEAQLNRPSVRFVTHLSNFPVFRGAWRFVHGLFPATLRDAARLRGHADEARPGSDSPPAPHGAPSDHLRAEEDALREATWNRLEAQSAASPPFSPPGLEAPLRIGWVLPHLGPVGGVRRAIEMTNRFAAWGHDVSLITPEGIKTGWLPIRTAVITAGHAATIDLDAVVFSDPEVIDAVQSVPARLRINYHLGAYMLYREPCAKLGKYYAPNAETIHIANSRWTARRVEGLAGLRIEKIVPGGIDRDLFHPVKTEPRFDAVYYGSSRPHKGTHELIVATRGLRGLSLSSLDSPQSELARHISSARVFASACWHEGFNFCPLEAMACGVPVAMTDDGGSRDYVRDGENALVVPPCDPEALGSAIRRLLDDAPQRRRQIVAGMETAWSYDWDRVTADLLGLITSRMNPR